MDLSHKHIQRNAAIAWRIIDDEALLVSPKDSLIYPLNSVGTRIWELLENKNSCAAVVDTIADEFAGDTAVIKAETLSFIEGLIDTGLAVSS